MNRKRISRAILIALVLLGTTVTAVIAGNSRGNSRLLDGEITNTSSTCTKQDEKKGLCTTAEYRGFSDVGWNNIRSTKGDGEPCVPSLNDVFGRFVVQANITQVGPIDVTSNVPLGFTVILYNASSPTHCNIAPGWNDLDGTLAESQTINEDACDDKNHCVAVFGPLNPVDFIDPSQITLEKPNDNWEYGFILTSVGGDQEVATIELSQGEGDSRVVLATFELACTSTDGPTISIPDHEIQSVGTFTCEY